MKKTSITEKNTRYLKGGETAVVGDKLGWWSRRDLAQSPDDTIVTIGPKYHQLPHLLAADVYGKSDLMWLILQYNNIVDVTTEFVAGAQIRLPLPRRVMQGLL
jgi:hypothetical protein